MNDEILILGDERIGTVSQSIGLAQEIGPSYRIIDLKYNKLATLPNFLFQESLIRLENSSKIELEKITNFPKFIISAGRKSATTALYLKKKSQGRSKVIQIMNPNLNFKKFDLVILPKHDGINEKDFPNVINTIGALTKVNDQKILEEREKFASWFENGDKPKIALMLGGPSKKTKFTNDSGISLAKTCSQLANNMNATLFILNSRRTGDVLTEAIQSNLDCDSKFFDWKDLDGKNPYLASLAIADFFIITGDSVSMISECCSTGKPVYIFDEAELSSPKHRKFHQDLFLHQHAKKLDLETPSLVKFIPQALRETRRLSQIIKNKF
jgi:mitochondrial fission protein ELM1